MNIDLSGKTILVTGASRGIGAVIARTLGTAGARVALHFGHGQAAAETIAQEIGQGAAAFGANLAKSEDVERLWADVCNKFGRVDGLVNNAGVAVEAPLSATTERWLAAWQSTMDVNLTAPGLLCRAAVGHFLNSGGGHIVNIASRAAFRGDAPDYLAYAASKAGLVALTRSLARAFGKEGVKAFVVAPGFTRTDMAQAFIDQYGEDYATNDIALNRMTEPDDIAPMIAFLLSGYADHATGATIDINAASYVR